MAYSSASAECTDWWNPYSCPKCPLTDLYPAANLLNTANTAAIFSRISGKKLQTLYGPAILHTWKRMASGIFYALSWTCFPGKLFPGTFPPGQMWIWSWLPSKKLMKNVMLLMGLCFTLTGDRLIRLSRSGSFWILLMLCSFFPKKDTPLRHREHRPAKPGENHSTLRIKIPLVFAWLLIVWSKSCL